MANSLRAKLSKLRHDGNITDAEYQELIKKLDGHGREIRNKAIDEFAERLKEKAERESIGTHFPDGLYGEVVEVGELKNMIDKIAEEMRGAE